jgi:nitrite reductase (NO-forming)/hydroxylamine reductase
MKRSVARHASILALAAFAAVGGLSHAADKGMTQPEMNFQAGTSPLANEPMYQSTNPKAPPDVAGRV